MHIYVVKKGRRGLERVVWSLGGRAHGTTTMGVFENRDPQLVRFPYDKEETQMVYTHISPWRKDLHDELHVALVAVMVLRKNKRSPQKNQQHTSNLGYSPLALKAP